MATNDSHFWIDPSMCCQNVYLSLRVRSSSETFLTMSGFSCQGPLKRNCFTNTSIKPNRESAREKKQLLKMPKTSPKYRKERGYSVAELAHLKAGQNYFFICFSFIFLLFRPKEEKLWKKDKKGWKNVFLSIGRLLFKGGRVFRPKREDRINKNEKAESVDK